MARALADQGGCGKESAALAGSERLRLLRVPIKAARRLETTMATPDPAQPPGLPDHIAQTMQSIAELEARHERRATPTERAIERVTALIARPACVLVLIGFIAAWIAANTALHRLGLKPFDRQPYNGLQGLLTVMGLFVAIVILATQRRADKLANYREQLILELSVLAEQKTAKVIGLLEEMRRDSPYLKDRHDPQAETMARPSDPGAVLDALVGPETDEDAGPGDA
jgi:uncharacterized membrane protein